MPLVRAYQQYQSPAIAAQQREGNQALSRWLSRVGRTFASIGIVAVLLGLSLAGALLYRVLDAPVMAVTITTPLQRVSQREIEEIVGAAIDDGFLSLDLVGLRKAIEKHPWVAQATTRRHWPDRIEIAVEEEVAIARWGKLEIVNQNGKLIQINDVSALAALPYLSGPGDSVREVMAAYREASELLFAYGLGAKEFGMDDNGQWRIYLDVGFTVLLGQRNIMAKLSRFLEAWRQQLKKRKSQIWSVDARYENGVAVSWR